MPKFVKRCLAVLISATVLLCICGCSVGAEEVQLNNFFGAPVTLVISSEHTAAQRNNVVKSINARLYEIENALSTEKADSDIAKLNAQSGEKRQIISPLTATVLSAAKRYYDMTCGAFDPAVCRLTDLWGFSARHAAKTYEKIYAYDRDKNEDGSFDLPGERYIAAFKALTGFDYDVYASEDGSGYVASYAGEDVAVDGVSYNSWIDLAGIAKGYAADEAKKIIDDAGVKGAYISFGGSSLYLSDKAGESWTLGIVDPVKSAYRGTFAKIEVKNKFVATSGTYENRYVVGGKTYHHIIDPATGRPSESGLISVTLVGGSGTETDALATAMIIMGKERALDFLSGKNAESVEGYILVTDDKKVYTNIDSFILRDDSFEVVAN